MTTVTSHLPPTPGHTRPSRLSSTPSARHPTMPPSLATETRSPRPLPHSTAQSMPPPLATHPRTPHARVQQQQGARTPSPGYFSLAIDSASDMASSGAAHVVRANQGSVTSIVRSTAAESPHPIPLDANPEFDAFRRQTESKSFTLGYASLSHVGRTGSTTPHVPRDPRRLSSGHPSVPLLPTHEGTSRPRDTPFAMKSVAVDENPVSRSPKRTLPSPYIPDRPRRHSPASFLDSTVQLSVDQPDPSQHDRHARFSLPPPYVTTPPGRRQVRAETLPMSPEADSSPMKTPQYIVNLLETRSEDVLLLDLRVQTQYAKSRICGALNLCIPTTLLKRPSFDLQKLMETFKQEEQRKTFESWRNSKYIVVYDACSSQMKDATSCIHILKKFADGEWDGNLYIISGGFAEFARKFPRLIENSSGAGSSRPILSLNSEGPAVAPVAGGCPMPETQSAANPFFGNIRQNMDLIGGVGQIPLARPTSLTEQHAARLPSWLRQVTDNEDKGKTVADRFLAIEKKEQNRMQEALSGKVSYGAPRAEHRACQLAGIEKGSKNRYNNIWPYEHSRVRLQEQPQGGCDYINGNYVKASWSNKRYIATQGPIPATFTDFWTVVWQEDVRVIVMLTAEKEGGQLKAHNYWKDSRYGPFRLNFLSEHRASLEPERIHGRRSDRPGMGRRHSTNPSSKGPEKLIESPTSERPYVIVRKFTLAHGGKPFERMREITQLQYSSWPDFGAPAHPQHLLGLVEQCDAVVRSTRSGMQADGPDPPHQRPVLVHCSAGCGRTGTFCTVDSVIDMLKRQRLGRARGERHGSPMHLDKQGTDEEFFFGEQHPEDHWVDADDQDMIEKTVDEFRQQRISMVQSLRQFVLCYETVLEWLAEQPPSPVSA